MRLIDADKIKRPANMRSPYSKMLCAEIDNAPTVKLSDIAMAEAVKHLAEECDKTCAFFNDCISTPIFCKWFYIAKMCATAEAENDGQGAD